MRQNGRRRPNAAGPTGRGGLPRGRAALALALALAASLPLGCAAPGSDVHLGPFFSRRRTADGRIETEALGGLYRSRRLPGALAAESTTLGPLWSVDRFPNGDWRVRYLVPLGFTGHREDEGRTLSWMVPFYVWTRGPKADGSREWRLATIVGLLLKSNEQSGTQFGWFPFWGAFENTFTYDEIGFVLWPLLVYARRGDKVSWHFPWPIFGFTRGGGETSHHLLPLYGRAKIEGRYDRTYFLWPLFHFQRNFLGGGGEKPESVWMLWPLFGHKTRGTYEAYTFLWPFFGYASDPRSGFWAFDGPFFAVRIQRGPGEMKRTRFWPFWSHLKTEDLEATNYLWPLIHLRKEHSTENERESVWIVPFWQSWNEVRTADGREAAWRKLFPLFQYERRGDWERGSFPTLDPFWRNELIERHYSWLWKLWEWERHTVNGMRRERAWLDLWHREKDLGEDRRSFAGLWSDRRYVRDGRRVRETSLLFGLLRWRVTQDEGFDMLPVAFPGPGWPAQRVPSPVPWIEDGDAPPTPSYRGAPSNDEED